jgi:hypothetical protein
VKLWELMSVCRTQPDLVAQTAAIDRSWSHIEVWCRGFNGLVADQDREKLDAELPEEFVIEVLQNYPQSFFLGGDRRLRSHPMDPDDDRLSAFEAYSRFGNVLEEALESGSVTVPQPPRHP